MKPRADDLLLTTTMVKPVRPPGYRWVFALWMGTAAAIAVAGGLVLGILAALQTGIAADRWTQTVQAHGRLQLWAFVGVFIVTLSFEFLVRMNGRPPFATMLRIGVPAGLVLGAWLMAIGQLAFANVEELGVVGGVVLLTTASVFCFNVVRVRPPQPLSLDPQPWFFWLGSVWLLVAAAFSLIAASQWESGTSLPLESHVVAEAFQRGFVLQMILAVGPRALRGHLGLPALSARRQIALLLIVNLGTAAWIASQEVWILPGIEPMERAANLALAVGVFLLTAWLRVFAGLSKRFRSRERYEWAVPLAWVGIVAYGVGLAGLALAAGDTAMYRTGAVRHIFLAGFTIPLMLAMAHIVLSRFGTGTIPWENLLTAGFVLSLVAWPLRVLPALLSESPGELGQGIMAVAGLFTMVALAFAMLVCFQTAANMRRPVQRSLHALSG